MLKSDNQKPVATALTIALANVHGQRQKNFPDSGLDPFH